jgi:two-component system sensor histidine kinase CpxA
MNWPIWDADFDSMAERIEALMLTERRLLGDISHELRSPLARLQVALDLAFQTADEETRGFPRAH